MGPWALPGSNNGSAAHSHFGRSSLRSACREVESFDRGLVSLVADLEEHVAIAGRAGLAANQIGVVRRVFSWNIAGEVGHLVNPVIEAEEGEQYDDGEEGCLSIPGLFYPCPRAEFVRARGFNVEGEAVVVEGHGLMARCIQHEVDHLDGRLFIDRLSGAVRKHAMRYLRQLSALGESQSARSKPLWR
jgi:peptide deformylase